MAEKPCEECGKQTKIKFLGKIRGRQLCQKCRIKVRENHRKETRESISEEERENIRELSRKQKAEYQRAYYDKHRKVKQRETKELPKIKGSVSPKKKTTTESYWTFEDQKQLLRILMQKGLDFEEAKERVKEHKKQQKEVREKMKDEKKSEKEIKVKQKEMLEELWKY